IAQGRGDEVEHERNVPDPTGIQATFEPRDRLVPCALAEVDMADIKACLDEAVGVIESLGNPETLFAVGQPFTERAQLGKTPGQPGMRHDRGRRRQAETLPEQYRSEEHT